MRDEVQAKACPTTTCIQMQTKVKSKTTLAIVSTLQVRSKTFFRSHKYTDNVDFSNLTAEQVAQLRAALDAAPPPPESPPHDAAPSPAPAAEKRQAPERGAAEKADSPSPARKKKTPKKDRKKKKKSSSAKHDAALAGPLGPAARTHHKRERQPDRDGGRVQELAWCYNTIRDVQKQ